MTHKQNFPPPTGEGISEIGLPAESAAVFRDNALHGLLGVEHGAVDHYKGHIVPLAEFKHLLVFVLVQHIVFKVGVIGVAGGYSAPADIRGGVQNNGKLRLFAQPHKVVEKGTIASVQFQK